tara:strand:- start:10 stop:273 length:264 start_codon:yes stop_codon:yes gene_type:complete
MFQDMNFNLGDLVGLRFTEKNIKLGIIIDSKKDNFIVKWIWYDKLFFMDNCDALFVELNRQYLLSETTYTRKHEHEVGCLKNLSIGF